MEISIVIPAYNEERRIKQTLQKILKFFKKKNIEFEIIVVSDGSADNTVKIVRSFKNKLIRIIDYKRNYGKGYCVRKGMLEAKGDIILFSDADLSTPIKEIDKFITYFDQGYDVVIGSRVLKDSDIKIRQPFYREWLGRIFNFVVQMIAIKGIKDTQCGFKAFTHSAAKKIFNLQKLNGFSFDVEALYIGEKLGYRIKEVGVTWVNSDSSKVNPLKDSIKMFKDVIKIKKLHKKEF